MKKYRHRVNGRIMQVTEHSNGYLVYDYRKYLEPTLRHNESICLTAEDFNTLFEPVEEYCCDWFKGCVEHRIIRKDIVVRHHRWIWEWNAPEDTFITECPFCQTRL